MKQDNKELLKNTTLLLVDDNISLRKKLRKMFDMYVMKIYEASNGEEALKIFYEKKPNIIVSDISMPQLNGLELIKKIRELDIKTPIVILSAYSDKEMLFEAIKLNLIEYLVKPLDYDKLDIVLDNIAEKLKQTDYLSIKLSNNVTYDFSKKFIIKDDEIITLTKKEQDFLELLLKNRGKIVSKDVILYQLWEDIISNSALKNLTLRLRKKIGYELFLTIPNKGFIIDI